MNPDILEEVPPKKIQELWKIFKKDLELYYPLCQYVEIMEEYRLAGITVPKQTLYRYGKDTDGVYLFEAYFDLGDTSYTLFHVFTAAKDLSDLEEALLKTGRIPWFKSVLVFQVTLARFAPTVRKVGKEKGVTLKGFESELLWLPPDQDLQVSKVPDDLELKFLNKNHAELIGNQRESLFTGWNECLGIQISNNFGLGLFRKSDAKMVCYGLVFNSGGIFCLFTGPENRGKGYADIIIRNLSKELRLRLKIPFATVREGNIPSQKVFRRIGFKFVSKVEYISKNYYI